MPIFNRCRKNLILPKKFGEDLTGLNWASNPLIIGNCGQLALNGLGEKRRSNRESVKIKRLGENGFGGQMRTGCIASGLSATMPPNMRECHGNHTPRMAAAAISSQKPPAPAAFAGSVMMRQMSVILSSKAPSEGKKYLQSAFGHVKLKNSDKLFANTSAIYRICRNITGGAPDIAPQGGTQAPMRRTPQKAKFHKIP